ncbi:MAG: threonine/serine dehydratase [Halocynthiibacter sp.]
MNEARASIKAAATRIEPYIRRTPVITASGFGLGFPVELKLEHLQYSGSFKARGAFNSLLSAEIPAAGIVAASGGNHGAAVAHAASRLGHRARVYVPEIAGPAKIALIRRTGADLVQVAGSYDDALKEALVYEAETGAMQVHAYDAPATVLGQGTLAAEWQAQGLTADTLLIAVGGGGLIAGALSWFNGARKIVAVEPALAPTLNRALQTGPDTEVDVSGVAANALGARRIGKIAHRLAQEQAITSLTVSDDAIVRAQHLLWADLRVLVEPAGAVALAALTSQAYVPDRNERVAVLLCGGNISPDPVSR